VTADQPQYAVRQKAKARIKVTQGGKPLAGAEVAFAAVDEACSRCATTTRGTCCTR
jgi:hypothetical protein